MTALGLIREEAAGRSLQAGLRPNPEAELEFEDIGSDEWSGPGDAEITLLLTQPIETAGKRARRKAVGSAGEQLADAELERARLELATHVAQLFYRTLAAQQRVRILEESHALARELVETVQQLVSAGKVSPVQLSKATVERARRAVAAAESRAELDAARHELAATWGARVPSFDHVSGDLQAVAPAPSLDGMLEHLDRNPDLALAASERYAAEAELALVRAEAAPDITVGAGIRRSGAEDDSSFLVAVSVPIPLFDRNQGAVAEAKAAAGRYRHRETAARLDVEVGIATEHRRLQQTAEAVGVLNDEVLPAAQSAFEAARNAYALGKEGYLDLLDAQQTLFETQMQLVDSLLEYHQTRCALMRLIGAPPDIDPDRK